MALSNAARSVLKRAGVLLAAAVAVGLATAPAQAEPASGAPAKYTFSYEKDYQGWVARTDQNTGTPECLPHNSKVARSTAMARQGQYSVGFQAHGRHDCGLLWLEREFNVGTTAPVNLDLSFWVNSQDTGSVGAGGVNKAQAYAAASCVGDPVQGGEGDTWNGFHDLGGLGHDTPGWYQYNYTATVTPSARGTICVAQSVTIASTYDFIKNYYLDETTVTIS